MGAKHGPEITVVCPILLHIVRLRSYLGNNTGTMFLCSRRGECRVNITFTTLTPLMWPVRSTLKSKWFHFNMHDTHKTSYITSKRLWTCSAPILSILETTGPSITALMRAPSTASRGIINVFITYRGQKQQVGSTATDWRRKSRENKSPLTSGPSSASPAMQPYRVVHWVFSSSQLWKKKKKSSMWISVWKRFTSFSNLVFGCSVGDTLVDHPSTCYYIWSNSVQSSLASRTTKDKLKSLKELQLSCFAREVTPALTKLTNRREYSTISDLRAKG